ncbi:MAG TPA: hypothetical protein VNM72_01310 [Blastocatellia bacterium]|nr:hypothetical protein [Blastocatellia bacterium]
MPSDIATPRATEQKSDGEPTCSGPGVLFHLRTFLDGKLLHSTDGRLSRQSGKLSRSNDRRSRSEETSRASPSLLVRLGGIIERSRRFSRFALATDARGFRRQNIHTLFEKPERL